MSCLKRWLAELALRGGPGVEYFDLALDLLAQLCLGDFQVVARLEPEPDARRGTKVAGQPQGRVGGDGALC